MGAAATLIEAREEPTLSAFFFGTDGTGANTLLVTEGGARSEEDAIKPRHRKRWASQLYMDGPSLISFAVAAIPQLVQDVLDKAQLQFEDIDLFILHQATRKMLEQIQERLDVGDDKLPISMDMVGNTVSATIPILIDELRHENKLKTPGTNMLIGFGVGWSWAGCIWKS